MSERNADYLQKFMEVVEVHLFHAHAIDAQQILHLKQSTVEIRQQMFFYASLQGQGKSR